jgi:outer membrane protein TolC
VTSAYLNLKTAEQRVTTAEAEVANAQESLRLAQGRYRAGLGVFLDVIDTQAALLTAETNQANAQLAVDQARAALAHAINADPTLAAS